LVIFRSEASMGRLLLIPLPLMLAGYVLLSAYQTEPMGVRTALAAALTAQPTTRGCDAPPALSYKIPTVIAGPNSQANVNCLAWQDFIAVNCKLRQPRARLTRRFQQQNLDSPTIPRR
jgi:hypothetical protein